MIVYNHDIAGLQSRINRFIEELTKGVSSGTSQVNQFDQERLETYLNAVDIYHNWVIAQPLLDLPETHPREIELEDNPAVVDVENESVNDIIRIMEIARDELVNSQSARDACCLNRFDSSRLRTIIEKVRKFLHDYIQQATPLDLPESSPQAGMSGPGRGGV